MKNFKLEMLCEGNIFTNYARAIDYDNAVSDFSTDLEDGLYNDFRQRHAESPIKLLTCTVVRKRG